MRGASMLIPIFADASVASPSVEADRLQAWAHALPLHWPSQNELLNACQRMAPGTAALLILAGIVYLMFGFQFFRALIMLNAAIVGAWTGAMLGGHGDAAVSGAIIGGFITAAIAWPTMKWTVAMLGGAIGFAVGVAVWRTSNLDPSFAWAGGGMGLILFCLLSFIIFRGSVILYTATQGSAMLVMGLLGMVYKYQQAGPVLTKYMTAKDLILPAAVFVPGVIGLIYQQSQPAVEPAKKK